MPEINTFGVSVFYQGTAYFVNEHTSYCEIQEESPSDEAKLNGKKEEILSEDCNNCRSNIRTRSPGLLLMHSFRILYTLQFHCNMFYPSSAFDPKTPSN